MADKYSTIRYNRAPTVNHPRTRFNLSHEILTTFNTGELVPILSEFVNPGETVDLKFSSLTRLETSLHQTMDNAYIEFAYFAVPLRILWNDFEKFQGANDDAWAQTTTYTIPQINLTGASAAGQVNPGSLLNHLMLPAGLYGSGGTNPHLQVEELSLKAVYEVWNQWYRDENYDSIIYYTKASGNHALTNHVLLNGANFYANTSMLKVHRLRDRFSTVLPAPQKGQEVSFGLTGIIPITAVDGMHSTSKGIRFGHEISSPVVIGGVHNLVTDNDYHLKGRKDADASPEVDSDYGFVSSTNLVADLGSATAVTINQLRLALVRQAMLERDSRMGTRYFETIQSRWNTTAPDMVLDRCEYLGGKRIPVSMMEVLQTSETGTTVYK